MRKGGRLGRFPFFGLFFLFVHFGKWCYWWNFVCARFPVASNSRASSRFMMVSFEEDFYRVKNKLPSNRTSGIERDAVVKRRKIKMIVFGPIATSCICFPSAWRGHHTLHSMSDIAEWVVFANANVPLANNNDRPWCRPYAALYLLQYHNIFFRFLHSSCQQEKLQNMNGGMDNELHEYE